MAIFGLGTKKNKKKPSKAQKKKQVSKKLKAKKDSGGCEFC
jgi:hypothetical protein